MERKKPEEIIPFQPSSSMLGLEANGQLTPLGFRQPENKRDQMVLEEYRVRQAVLKAIGLEAKIANQILAELQAYSFSVFEEYVTSMFATKEKHKNTELQPYFDEFFKRSVNSVGTHQFGINEVAATGIAMILHKEHYPYLPEEHKSWLQKIFGS